MNILNTIVEFLMDFFSPYPIIQEVLKDFDNSFIQEWEDEVMERIKLSEVDDDWSDYQINWEIFN